MELVNDLLTYIQNLDPIILIIGGLIVIGIIVLLLRFATTFAIRILTIGCIVIIILGVIFIGIPWLFN